MGWERSLGEKGDASNTFNNKDFYKKTHICMEWFSNIDDSVGSLHRLSHWTLTHGTRNKLHRPQGKCPRGHRGTDPCSTLQEGREGPNLPLLPSACPGHQQLSLDHLPTDSQGRGGGPSFSSDHTLLPLQPDPVCAFPVCAGRHPHNLTVENIAHNISLSSSAL